MSPRNNQLKEDIKYSLYEEVCQRNLKLMRNNDKLNLTNQQLQSEIKALNSSLNSLEKELNNLESNFQSLNKPLINAECNISVLSFLTLLFLSLFSNLLGLNKEIKLLKSSLKGI